jgi:hypothetical protein
LAANGGGSARQRCPAPRQARMPAATA